MIELTRLNGSLLVVNSDLIQYAEAAPDTTLTLLNGEKVVIRESTSEVIDLAVAYRARIMGEASRYSSASKVSRPGDALSAISAEKNGKHSEELDSGVNYVARRRAIQD